MSHRSFYASGRGLTAVIGAAIIIFILLSTVATPVRARADQGSDPVAEALAQAEQTGQSVPIPSATTETTSLQANPDATLTVTIAAGPVQEPDVSSPDGWSAVDLSLQQDQGQLAPTLSAADTAFSAGGTGALATLSQGGDEFTESWDGSLPTPTVSGDTAVYPSVMPGIDLVMQAQVAGFEQSFLVHAPPVDPLEIDVPLSLDGLSASVDGTGALVVTDASGTPVATSGTATMWGAAIDDHTGEPTASETVTTEIVSGQSGLVMKILPDPAFFTRPDVTYPIEIDPAPNLAVTTDSYVKQSAPTSSFSTNNELKIGTPDGSDVLRSLISFGDVASAIGSDAVVDAATLDLHETASYSCTQSTVEVYDATSTWGSSVTWNTQPTAGTKWASGSFALGYSSSCPAGTVHLSAGGANGLTLTDLVQNWTDGNTADNGLVVRAASETDLNGWKKFSASESGAHAPTLTVTYHSPDFTHHDGFWQTAHDDATADVNSATWLRNLSGLLSDDWIKLAGTDSGSNAQFGIPNYSAHPNDNDGPITIYCHYDPSQNEPCSGFPIPAGTPPFDVSFTINHMATTDFPANSPTSEAIIIDKLDTTPVEAWFRHLCPPGYTTGNAYCSTHADTTNWTATDMSVDRQQSDGLDGCWPDAYGSQFPSYDQYNQGGLGVPSPYRAIRLWEVLPGNLSDQLDHSLVIHLPDTAASNYFPLSSHDGGSGGQNHEIPEGAILRLNQDYEVPSDITSQSLIWIIDALKNYGAVVGDPSADGTATIEMEALYIDGFSSQTWASFGVSLNALQEITLDATNFTFAQHGAGGPTHDQWYQHGEMCEPDPG